MPLRAQDSGSPGAKREANGPEGLRFVERDEIFGRSGMSENMTKVLDPSIRNLDGSRNH